MFCTIHGHHGSCAPRPPLPSARAFPTHRCCSSCPTCPPPPHGLHAARPLCLRAAAVTCSSSAMSQESLSVQPFPRVLLHTSAAPVHGCPVLRVRGWSDGSSKASGACGMRE
ncbi:hypothetical protein BS78_06G009400 [Paspalum vaginatum]|nr:hypothetical protein BS78_06G009400 [Paspalum vaginatum]